MRAASRSASRSGWLVFSTLTFIAGGCSDSTSPGNPAKLVFTVEPATTTAGQAMSPVIVEIQDSKGRVVTSATNAVTLSLAGGVGGASLGGTLTVSAVNGLARFTDITVDKVGGGYTFAATSPNLTGASSTSFVVVGGAPAKLEFVIQPATTLAHTGIPTFQVAVQDAGGNTVITATNNITLTIATNPASGSLSGAASAQAVNGVATFTGLSINNVGSGYTLRASSANLTSATSAPFNITLGLPTKLGFVIHPLTTPPGAVMPPVVVAVEDVAGNTIPTATNLITLAIGSNTVGATLSGNAAVAAVNGVATFSTLSIDKTGAGFTLTATSPDIIGTVSSNFSIRNPLVFTMVTAGYFHSCGLVTGGAAYCWGANDQGRLGAPGGPTSGPVPVSGGLTFSSLVAGRDHTCGMSAAGVAYCWGSNANGQLGTGGSQSQSPVLVLGSVTLASAVAGYGHSCGLTPSGAGYCWGANGGALGNGTTTSSSLPVAVSGGLTFSSISVGRSFTCGLSTTGTGYCWGSNTLGELGDGTKTSRNAPVSLNTIIKFSAIQAGGFHACALDLTGAAYCWGDGAFGQLGVGAASSTTPVVVSGGLKFVALTAGNRHNCGLTAEGIAYCWGDNINGNLGNGSTTNSNTPWPVSGGHIWTSISAGRFHSCGVASTGVAYCWGQNVAGEVGDGTTERRLVPVPVR